MHPDTKKLIEVTFYVAMKDGSMLLSYKTTLLHGLIQLRPRLDYLPPRASLITSSADHPKKTRQCYIHKNKTCPLKLHSKKWLLKHQLPKRHVPKLITSKEMILYEYPDVFERIGKFPGPDYHIQGDPNIAPKQHLADQSLYTLKKKFQQEINKMLQAGVLAPVHKATPWINSFVDWLIFLKNRIKF